MSRGLKTLAQIFAGLASLVSATLCQGGELNPSVANLEVFKTIVDAFPTYGHKVARTTSENGEAYNFVSCPEGKKLLVEEKDLSIADKCPDGSGVGIFAGILSKDGGSYALNSGDIGTSFSFSTGALTADAQKSIANLLGQEVLVMRRDSQVDIFKLAP